MTVTTTQGEGLDRRDAMARLLARRDDSLIVTGLGSTTYDAGMSDHPNTFYLWGTMGAAAMVGLGLALAQPARRVVVVTGDGELLMGLGSLATIGAKQPDNLAIVVMDNGLYAETGMQPTHTARGVDLCRVAQACGFQAAAQVVNQTELDHAVATIFATPGPVFVDIKVTAKRYPMSIRLRDGVHIKNRFRENLLGAKAFD